MTQNHAATILENHGIEWAPSTIPGHIRGLMQWTRRAPNGAVISGETWEEIELKGSAIVHWLGY